MPVLAASFMSGLLLGGLVSLALCGIAGAWGYYKFVRLERRTRQAERLGELGMLTAGLAHEIKNPLSTLQLNLQLLREQLDDRISGLDDLIGLPAAAAGDLEERRKVLARMIRRLDGVTNEAGRLREILDGFLRYAGRIEAQPQPVDLARLANDLTDFLIPQASASRVRLVVESPQSVRATVDANLIKQAMLNLLLNAVQHSPEGSTVTLKLLPGNPLRVSVSDEGQGVPKEDQPRLFDPYYTRRKGGTGLGLAITRRIAEAHGGQIQVDSEPGSGATFSLVLPLRPRRRGGG